MNINLHFFMTVVINVIMYDILRRRGGMHDNCDSRYHDCDLRVLLYYTHDKITRFIEKDIIFCQRFYWVFSSI